MSMAHRQRQSRWRKERGHTQALWQYKDEGLASMPEARAHTQTDARLLMPHGASTSAGAAAGAGACAAPAAGAGSWGSATGSGAASAAALRTAAARARCSSDSAGRLYCRTVLPLKPGTCRCLRGHQSMPCLRSTPCPVSLAPRVSGGLEYLELWVDWVESSAPHRR